MFCVGSCRLSRSGRSMYVKSARINWYSLSGVASSTLLLTGFPSTLVRSPARTTRKFLRLMAILNGTKVLVRTTSSALRFHVHSTKEGFNNLCEMGHFSKPKRSGSCGGATLVGLFSSQQRDLAKWLVVTPATPILRYRWRRSAPRVRFRNVE